MPKHDLAESRGSGKWTKPDLYVQSLARVRMARKARIDKPRTQPETPRLLLSTLPFVALMCALAVLTAAIVIVAWPGSRPQPAPKAEAQVKGVAAKGWLQEAERDFHK